ncbi:MAG TPA: FHA domain-containing protein [Campylobacterales bacterium]|nr:FHA domain-containing protein [Campylobacterales bacterium]HHC11098.1 FHA domain-containing protein [Campylobacterales bacterium]
MIRLSIDNKEILDFTQDIIRVGRNKNISKDIEVIQNKDSADIFFKNQKLVSRKHCEIFKKDFQWYIKDLGSSNGTYLNKRPIDAHEDYPLRDGDNLMISSDVSIDMEFQESEDEESTQFEVFEDDKTAFELFETPKDRDDEETKKSHSTIFYLESISNRGAFKLDFSNQRVINLVELVNLNSIYGEINLNFHGGGYISLENNSKATVNINNKFITQDKILYDGNLIDINGDRFIFVEYTSMEIINGKPQNSGYVKTQLVNNNFTEDLTLGLPSYTTLNNGQYILLNRLGEVGGFGITYLAEDTKLSSKVAIKEYFPKNYAQRRDNSIIPTTVSESKDNFRWGYEAFKKEAQTIANLPKHSNIVAVKNLFEENGTVYYVMDYAQGEDLEIYLKRNRTLSQKDIEKILFPFLDGVKHLHKHNILHRDIKLSNIILTKNGEPILIDFGTARNQMIQRDKKFTSVYTEGYAALEQHTSSEEGPYTDIYAIGMLIYALMNGITDTGDLPSAIKRLDNQQSRGNTTLTFPKRFSKSFIKGVKKALEVQPQNRPQTIDEFIKLLEKKESNYSSSFIYIIMAIAIFSIIGAFFLFIY